MKNFNIDNTKGWNEVNLDDNCNVDVFYKVAEIIEKTFDVNFLRKLNDFDTLYWDFTVNEQFYTLYYNIYLGVSIFPTRFKDATVEENDSVIAIARQIFEKL